MLLGWLVFAHQLASDGWLNGGGTAWLLALAAVATVGALVSIAALTSGRPGWASLGLTITAASPTVFAYPLNLLLLILAIIEAALAISTGRRSRSVLAH
jgi:hypothetical protein